jgi:hypothetical protein
MLGAHFSALCKEVYHVNVIGLSAIDSCVGAATDLVDRFAAICMAVVLSVAPVLASAQDVDAGPYVPTPQYIVDRMLQMAAVTSKDYVIDLGSGDGRIVITAAKKFGAQGMGVDISEKLVDLATTNAYRERVNEHVKFVRQDAFKTSISNASVLTLYLLPKFVLELRPKMLNEMKPGSRVVSHDYSLGDWDADNSVTFDSPEKEAINGSTKTSLFYYVVPARVAGTWKLALPDGAGERSMDLQLQQSYQKVSGSAGVGKGRTLGQTSLRGDRFDFVLPVGARNHPVSVQIKADQMTGTIEIAGRGKLPFSAVRTAQGKAIGWQEEPAK